MFIQSMLTLVISNYAPVVVFIGYSIRLFCYLNNLPTYQ